MKWAVVLVLVALMAVAFISGCVQEGPTGELTEKQMDDIASQAVEEEMGDVLEDVNLEEL
ncbi:MAG: hypothetical protein JSW41_01200 [Candidatus Aenigmatarchaeota archaeon]|nr:MAG: hypothetical protein JSW41_01200 [Candidatus Aenigmarchaeota archaeon]